MMRATTNRARAEESVSVPSSLGVIKEGNRDSKGLWGTAWGHGRFADMDDPRKSLPNHSTK